MKRVPSLTLMMVIVAGLSLWVFASSGTKQAELGAGLVTSGVIGSLLVLFERSFTQQARMIEDVVSRAAAPPPATDMYDGATDEPGERVSERNPKNEKEHVGASVRRRFTVRYDGWGRDTTRIDASGSRLRAFRDDGSYFQFYTAIVSGIGLRTALGGASNVTPAQFRRAFVDLAVEDIRRTIANGEAPLDNPTVAIELFPDPDEAARRARHVEDREYALDEVVAEIEA